MNETIYNLLNHLPQCSSSQSTNSQSYYRSIFASNALHNLNRNKYSHRTMGPAVLSKPDPSHPLRRREKYIELPKITPFIRPHRMPPIPKVTEQHKHPSKNFITENKNKIINSLPVRPHRYIVSDRKGNKFLIDGSGLQKDFIYKKNYGEIPLYLQARKTSDEPLVCNSENNSMILLSPEERLCLINNLKVHHGDVFAEYQRLPLRIETASNIIKEADLNNQLINIENDINFLEKFQQIFIVNNNPDTNT